MNENVSGISSSVCSRGEASVNKGSPFIIIYNSLFLLLPCSSRLAHLLYFKYVCSETGHLLCE